MTPEQENIIENESKEKFPIHERHEYGGDGIVTIDINKPRREAYIAGRIVGIDENEKLKKEIERIMGSCKELNLVIDAWKIEIKQKDAEIKTLKDKLIVAKYFK